MDVSPLPAIVPIFPLSGVLLLPRSPLPLHIFEPRYRAMARDALAGDGYIAMVQPSDSANQAANPAIYTVACLGKIINSEELDDGRYNIILRGHSRLRVVQELPLKDGYRRIEADYSAFRGDRDVPTDSVDRDAVIAEVERYLERRQLQANWDNLSKANDEAVVNALSIACPFSPQEKQALLEADNLADRADLIVALCQMDARGTDGLNPTALH